MAFRLPGIALVVVLAAAWATQAKSADKVMRLGQHLAQECTSCHLLDGADNGIPSIVGLPPDYFVETLKLFKRGERGNPAMVSVAQSLDDEQIKALALYFASLPKADFAGQP